MRYIHPAAWAGLFINIMLAYFLYASFSTTDFSVLPPDQREAIEAFAAVLETIKPIHIGILALQAIGLGLVASRIAFGLGLVLVLFTSFLTLPASLIYALGCLLTHYRVKYSAFDDAPANYAGALFIYPSSSIKRMRVLSLAGAIGFLAFTIFGLYNVAGSFIAITAAGLFCIFRAKRFHALTIHQDYLTLSPGLLSGRLLIRYSSIEMATLMENETISFDVHTESGLQTIVFELATIAEENRRSAIEELGAALTIHNVPLK